MKAEKDRTCNSCAYAYKRELYAGIWGKKAENVLYCFRLGADGMECAFARRGASSNWENGPCGPAGKFYEPRQA